MSHRSGSEPSAAVRWRQRAARMLRVVLPLLVTLGLLGSLWTKLDRAELQRTLAQASPGWWLLAAALAPLQIGVSAERWRLATGAVGTALPRGRALREFALSTLLNQVLPGGVAGDVVRAVRVAEPGAPLQGARIVFIDRMVGLAVHLTAVLLGIALWTRVYPTVRAPWEVGVIAAALLLGMLSALAWPGALGREARRVLSGGKGLAQLCLSVGLTGSFLFGFWCCGRALGAVPGLTALTAVPIVLLSMALPISVGGWGLREWTAQSVLPPLGFEAEMAVGWSALYGLSVLVGSLPGVLALISWGRR